MREKVSNHRFRAGFKFHCCSVCFQIFFRLHARDLERFDFAHGKEFHDERILSQGIHETCRSH